ncbi:MAG: hypothetical protein J7521_19845 [Caulobacter sp.]|nr:hypothetical protein [Caulobacter sp.]
MSALPARRDLLAALVALAAAPAIAAGTPPGDALEGLDPAAAERIGRAWLAANPSANTASLARRLFPDGRSALQRLRRAAAADFRRGAVFVHRGWRLSDTEGALFGLIALKA